MRTEKKRELLKQLFIVGIIFSVLLGLQAFIKLGAMDDAVYAQAWNEKPLDMFLKDRYEGWSSRIIIEAVMMPLIACNSWVWRILNIFMVILLAWNTADLFAIKGGGKIPDNVFCSPVGYSDRFDSQRRLDYHYH